MKLRTAIVCLLVIPQLAIAQGVEDPLSYQVLLRMSGGLLLVVALVFAAAWGVRRFGRLPTTGNRTLQLLGGIAVGQRERVVLIRVGREQLLLGVAPGRVQMLHTLADEQADEAQPTGDDGGDQPCAAADRPQLVDGFPGKLRELLKRGVR